MTYYPDLSTASMIGQGENLRAVGWLSSGHGYSRGAVAVETLRTIQNHIDNAFTFMTFGGGHQCEFCNEAIGFSNLCIPTQELIYVAPELITHYIMEHGYAPPEEFLVAVRNCPQQSSPEYMDIFFNFAAYFPITASDPRPTADQQARIAKLIERALEDITDLCREGDAKGAKAIADACLEITGALHGWGLWYRHVFSRLVRNGRDAYPKLDEYLDEYNEIFGFNTDPELTAYNQRQQVK